MVYPHIMELYKCKKKFPWTDMKKKSNQIKYRYNILLQFLKWKQIIYTFTYSKVHKSWSTTGQICKEA